jgi:hypothetical protein
LGSGRASCRAPTVEENKGMFPLNYVLAVALLTAPPEPNHKPDLEGLATVRTTVRAVALAWELLDPQECRYTLSRPEDFPGDLRLLVRRQHELADAPPLCDSLRLPHRALVNELLAFNRAYRQHLDSRQSLEVTSWWELHETLQEVDRLYQIWDLVRDARCDIYYVSVRRQALKKLREAIGPDAYYSGTLPPHVPTWRFVRID